MPKELLYYPMHQQPWTSETEDPRDSGSMVVFKVSPIDPGSRSPHRSIEVHYCDSTGESVLALVGPEVARARRLLERAEKATETGGGLVPDEADCLAGPIIFKFIDGALSVTVVYRTTDHDEVHLQRSITLLRGKVSVRLPYFSGLIPPRR